MLSSEQSKKIAMSFTLVLGLMLIMILFDLSRMNIMQSKLDIIIKEHTVKTNLMIAIRTGIYGRQVSLRNILLKDNVFDQDAERLIFNSYAVDIIKARDEFAKMPLNVGEAKVLSEITNSMSLAYNAQIKLIEESMHGDNAALDQEELGQTFLTQEIFINNLDKMISLQTEATRVAVTDATKSYNEAKRSVYVLGGSGLFIGGLVAFFIIRLTESQSKNVRKAMLELELSREELEERVKKRTWELAKARDEALASNKSKDAFLATMSHELRTPLNIIVGYSELIEEMAAEIDPVDLVKDLKKIQTAANHQLKLINSILDISKIEEGKLDITAEDFEIETLLTEINSSILPLMSKNNNKFNIECSYGIGMMYSDSMRILQILLNMLSNAAKFTSNGTVTLTIFKDMNGNEIIFEVKDSGVGVAAEYIKNLFDEFTQEDSTTTRKYGGSGLGLSISKKLANLLHGDISVSSEKNTGSTFTLKLPVIYID